MFDDYIGSSTNKRQKLSDDHINNAEKAIKQKITEIDGLEEKKNAKIQQLKQIIKATELKYDTLINKSKSELGLLMDQREKVNEDGKAIFCRICFEEEEEEWPLRNCAGKDCPIFMCEDCFNPCQAEESFEDNVFCDKCKDHGLTGMECEQKLCFDCVCQHSKYCKC